MKSGKQRRSASLPASGEKEQRKRKVRRIRKTSGTSETYLRLRVGTEWVQTGRLREILEHFGGDLPVRIEVVDSANRKVTEMTVVFRVRDPQEERGLINALRAIDVRWAVMGGR